jgi:hypothetical protein
MAKRPTVEVDEDLLKEVMAGGVNRFRKTAPVTDKEVDTLAEPKVETAPSIVAKATETASERCEHVIAPPEDGNGEARDTTKSFRKRKEQIDYQTVFLARKASVRRKQTYLSTYLYDKIYSFLPVISGGLSITAYLDNIVGHHLEQYRDDINELYDKRTQKPL